MTDVKSHECVLVEKQIGGQPVLTPCKVCGATAASILERLRNDSLRQHVIGFIAEADRYGREAERPAADQNELLVRHRYHGQATARHTLADRLEAAGIDPTAAPRLEAEARAPRHAAAVRELHRLETLPGTTLQACAADGYITGDLITDPCPTLAALNRTDPAPVPAIDRQKLAGAIEQAVLGMLANGGINATDHARAYWIGQAVEEIAEDQIIVDLASPDTQTLIIDAITQPGRLVPREGDAIPGWHARAVIAALKKAR